MRLRTPRAGVQATYRKLEWPVATAITGRLFARARLNVARSIAHHANMSGCACQVTRLACGVTNEFCADREMVAESAKAKPLAQTGLLNLDPANHLQVACRYTEQALRARDR